MPNGRFQDGMAKNCFMASRSLRNAKNLRMCTFTF